MRLPCHLAVLVYLLLNCNKNRNLNQKACRTQRESLALFPFIFSFPRKENFLKKTKTKKTFIFGAWENWHPNTHKELKSENSFSKSEINHCFGMIAFVDHAVTFQYPC
tara:strand:+ start:1823 stop:2146 length:324 start_codon:yes stop_codon:yes gene_type:complete